MGYGFYSPSCDGGNYDNLGMTEAWEATYVQGRRVPAFAICGPFPDSRTSNCPAPPSEANAVPRKALDEAWGYEYCILEPVQRDGTIGACPFGQTWQELNFPSGTFKACGKADPLGANSAGNLRGSTTEPSKPVSAPRSKSESGSSVSVSTSAPASKESDSSVESAN